MEHVFGLKLGIKVTDDVTGFEGTVVGLVTYLYENDSACVRPTQLKDGRPQSLHWIDVEQLTEVVPLTEAEKADLREGLRDKP